MTSQNCYVSSTGCVGDAIMTSPPSSPPSSPPGRDISPPSSPIPESPLKKRRSWSVYRHTEDPNPKVARSTSWRWSKLHIDGGEETEVFPTEQQSSNALPTDEPEPDLDLDGEAGDQEDEPSTPNVDCFQFMSVESDGEGEDRESEHSGSSQDSSTGVASDSDESNQSDVNESVFSEASYDSTIDDTQSLSDEDQDDQRPLYIDSEFTVDEAVLDILTDHVTNHETLNSLKSHLKTLLKYLPKHNAMPKNVNQLLDYVLKLAPSYVETAHYYCSKCLLYCKENIGQCRACANEEKKAFYSFSLEEQIKFYFEECGLADILDKYSDKMHSKDGKIRDIADGSEYKRVHTNSKYSVTLLMNTDGVAIRDSSRTSIWPVMFSICEIPSYLRQRFMIVSGIWCDVHDPPMNTLLKPFVNTLQKLHNQGGVSWLHPNTKVVITSEVFCPIICADAPARAKIQNILDHGGNSSCNTCEQKRRRIALTPQEEALKAAGKKVKRKRAYVFQDPPAKLRTDAGMRRQARKAITLPPKKTAKGVKGPTVVALIPKLDISTCVYAEYMHGVCLGVTRQFLTLWFSVPGPWCISKTIDEADLFIKSILPTSDIGRLPRGMKDLSYWKASELRAWLLYYSLPFISDKLPSEYVQHWTLFVAAIYLLLQEEISERDLAMAEIMLKLFVRDIASLYRFQDYSYNVHQLLHLTLYVKRWGNLWSTSAFKFENYNAILSHLIHGTKNPAKELIKNLKLAHGLEILRHKVYGKSLGISSQICIEPLNCRSCRNVPDNIRAFLHAKFPEIKEVYLRVVKNKVVYTSKLYGREHKRNNYTVKFKTSDASGYGEIRYFFKKEETVWAVLDKFRIIHTAMFTHNLSEVKVNHIVPIESVPCALNVIVSIDHILAKVIRVGNFICNLPNRYERHNL